MPNSDELNGIASMDLPSLPYGWAYRGLGDLLQENGLSYGIVQPGSEDPTGIPIIRVKNIRRGRVLADEVLRVNKDIEAGHQRTRLNGGEVLLSLVGSVGEVAIAPSFAQGWNVARAIAVIRTNDPNMTSWVRICLESGLAQQYMHIWQTTTVQATLNLRDVRRLPIVLPPRKARDAITVIVGAFDEKIAANDRIAETARALARARFLSEQGTGHADDIELGSVVEFFNRGVTPRYTDDQSQLRVLNQKCVRDGRVSLGPSRRTLLDKVPVQKLLKVHDVLVNSTGVGTLGRVACWTNPEASTVDSHVTIVRFDPAKIDPVCAGFAMLDAEPEIEALGEGSTGQTELSRAQLSALRITVPSNQRSAMLRPVLDALETRGASALEESLSLAELRDTLLPKLMSGQIRVRDAEKVVEDVT